MDYPLGMLTKRASLLVVIICTITTQWYDCKYILLLEHKKQQQRWRV